ncbi:MAG: SpoIIE family protein phosphatase [Prevotellaceae bacterium]|nr:SpoIIE family protein phosphatase [Prevotellaceae bacterium]
MRKPSDSFSLFNSTLVALLIGGVIFVTGYFISLQILRSRVVELTNNSVSSEIQTLNTYVESRLRIVEEVAHAISWAEDRHGAVFAYEDWKTEDDIFVFLENLIALHPDVCGCAIGLCPELNIMPPNGQYGFATYVTDVTGKSERLRLGDINDYSHREWFKCAQESDDVYWSLPFCESNANKIVASFSLPLRDNNDKFIGVLALDFNLETLHDYCSDITNLDSDVVTVLDHDFRYVSNPDTTLLLTSAFNDKSDLWQTALKRQMEGEESGIVKGLKDGREYALYFSKVERTGWVICVECPMSEIYSDVNELRTKSAVIAMLSVLIVALCFIFLYRRMRGAQLAKSSLEADMKVAEDLQMGMLPKKQPAFPERKDMDIYGFLQPAKMVGGDLYDYILRDDKLFFCIGDISGKGVPAAMFMSIVLSYFHNKSKKVDCASELVASLNDILATENSENMFGTFFLGILNLRNGRLDFCNAGHDAPIMLRKTADGYEAELLPGEKNLVVGALEGIEFIEDYTTMRPGDSLFLFTDGVTEAENKNKDLFGVEATISSMKNIFSNNGNATAQEKVTMMRNVLRGHTGGMAQSDDITMLLVEYKGTTITLENKVEQLPYLSEFVKDMCSQYGVSDDIIDDICVSMDEIGANITQYAFPTDEIHTYNVSFHHEAGELVFTFEDEGVPFDPTEQTDPHFDLPPEERPLGGLGIMMVKEMMDKVEYERRGNKNIVCIVKKYK